MNSVTNRIARSVDRQQAVVGCISPHEPRGVTLREFAVSFGSIVPRGLLLLLLMATVAKAQGQKQDVHFASAHNNMVATVHPLATQAGLTALDVGGNAIDAAIAAALTLGVVDGYNSGIGGGCFILIRTADGALHAIDGREMAPLSATHTMFLRDGKPDVDLSQNGPLAVGTPGALAAYDQAVRRFGRLSLAQLITPAADIADQGFEVDPIMAEILRATQERLKAYGGAVGGLLKMDGTLYSVGERMLQPDLAKTYRAIARDGINWFYRGEFALKTDAWFAAHGGILSAKDLAAYRTVEREPLVTDYRGYTIVGFPPPSSGGVHVAQILNILENFDLSELNSRDPALMHHVVAEAMKLAFADRAFWLGDPDFVDVPRGLIDKNYAQSLAAKISLDSTIHEATHGDPRVFDDRVFQKHTTHIATADAEGNWVAITTTVNTSFGSKVIVPGTGVVLNNQMDDFAISPGTPNAFGLVGAEANSVAPGKRPLSSMSPTIILKDGRPVMTVGAAGGPKIITQVVLAIIRRLDLHLSLEHAVSNPRIHHQWLPDALYCEPNLDQAQRNRLQALGHTIKLSRSAGVCQAIWFDSSTRTFVGVADPRANGCANGR